MSINYDYDPGMPGCPPLLDHMKDGIRAHIETGQTVGHFLTALLENDLMEACSRADRDNRDALVTWHYFLYNQAPRGCYGSKENVKAWRKAGGLNGMQAEEEKADAG